MQGKIASDLPEKDQDGNALPDKLTISAGLIKVINNFVQAKNEANKTRRATQREQTTMTN